MSRRRWYARVDGTKGSVYRNAWARGLKDRLPENRSRPSGSVESPDEQREGHRWGKTWEEVKDAWGGDYEAYRRYAGLPREEGEG